MSSFEITGTVQKVEEKTSAKGNAYLTFQIKDTALKVFELSLFGDGLALADKLKPSKQVIIKGVLTTREFQDKNQTTRYGIELRPQWVEEVEVPRAGKNPTAQQQQQSLGGFNDIPF